MSINITDIILFLYPGESISFTYPNGESLSVEYNSDTTLKINNDQIISLASVPYILKDTRMPKEIFLQRDQDITIWESPEQISQGILKLQKERFKSSLKNTIMERGYILRDTRAESVKEEVIRYKSAKYKPDREIFEKIEEYKQKIQEMEKEISKAEKHVEQLTKILDASENPNREEALKKPLAGLRYRQELLQRYRERLDRYNQLVNRKTFTVSDKEEKKIVAKTQKGFQSLEESIDRFRNCDYKLFERLWNDRENYGPVVASLIFGGCLKTKALMPSLMKIWTDFKTKIIQISERLKVQKSKIPLFVRVYEELVQKETNCYFKKGSINFLTDLYVNGSCNCQCGTYLAYILSQMFPEPNVKVFPVYVMSHIYLIAFEGDNIYKIETTGVMNFYKPMDIEKFRDDFLNIIGNEQLLGLYIIDQSIPYEPVRMGGDIFFDMIDYDDDASQYLRINYDAKGAEKVFKEGFSSINKTFLKTPLDITTLIDISADHIFGSKLSLQIIKNLKPLQMKYIFEVLQGKSWNVEELEKEWKVILEKF